jgi:hypothetical protein
MTIFALFYCIASAGICQMWGEPRATFAGITPAVTFSKLKECEQFGQRVSGHVLPPVNGRFLMPNGNWYECRSKHVDTWQPAR